MLKVSILKVAILPRNLKSNRLKQIVKETLKYEGVLDAEVSLVLGDDELLKRLNKEYREVDEPTDVLAFGLGQTLDVECSRIPGQPPMLGEIIISLDAVNRQAKEYNHSFEKELAILSIHGLLHLLGYDHSPDNLPQEQMAVLTNEILAHLATKQGIGNSQ